MKTEKLTFAETLYSFLFKTIVPEKIPVFVKTNGTSERDWRYQYVSRNKSNK